MKSSRKLNFLIMFLAIGFVLSTIGYVVASSIQNYSFTKPLFVNVESVDSMFQVMSMDFVPNIELEIFEKVTVQIYSGYGEAKPCTLVFAFWNGSLEIARGVTTTTLDPLGTSTVDIILSWVSGKTTTDVSHGKLMVI